MSATIGGLSSLLFHVVAVAAPPPVRSSAMSDGPGGSEVRNSGVPPLRPPASLDPNDLEPRDTQDVGGPPADLSGTWSYARGTSPKPRFIDAPGPRRAAAVRAHPVGHYSGVKRDNERTPPHPVATFGTKPMVLTWTGFERGVKDGDGPRVFFQLNGDVAYEISRRPSDPKTIVVRMPHTRINVRNNLRSLDLRYFGGPIRDVRVSRRGRDTIATLTLQQAGADIEATLTAAKSGYRMLVLRVRDAAKAPAPDAALGSVESSP